MLILRFMPLGILQTHVLQIIIVLALHVLYHLICQLCDILSPILPVKLALLGLFCQHVEDALSSYGVLHRCLISLELDVLPGHLDLDAFLRQTLSS